MPEQDIPRRTCGTMPVHQLLVLTDPEYRQNRLRIEAFSSGYTRGRRDSVLRDGVVRIPVVVHVLHRDSAENISDAQVTSQLDVLNHDFRMTNSDLSTAPPPFRARAGDARIEFVLADRDPSGASTNGITRRATSKSVFHSLHRDAHFTHLGGTDAWPTDRYLNIWVVPGLTDGARKLLGYGQFPGGSAATDGVVILHRAFGTNGTATAPYHLGRTTTHEVGHFLNLLHIWGDDDGRCDASDAVGDTPNQADANVGKPAFPCITCGNAPDGDMFVNYMDYSDDDSMCLFTVGQVARMRATLSGPRASLVLSSGGDAPPDAGRVSMSRFNARASAAVERGERPTRFFDGVGWVSGSAIRADVLSMLGD
ncbi:MAG TPA: zinc metalloprotease [Gemmatimonadaceae bacterium]